MSNDINQVKFFDLRKIIASMPECVYWKDIHGRYKGGNKLFLQMLGFKTVKELINKTDHDIGEKLGCNEAVVQQIIHVDQEIVKTGIPKFNIEELPFEIADGTTIWQRTSKMPIKDGRGRVVGIIGISVDFTKQKKAELAFTEQVRKTELAYKLNSEFLSIAAHEIRGPISNVISLLNILQKNKKSVALFKDAASEADNAINSIDYLLKLLSLDRETFNSSNGMCNLKDFMEISIKNVRNEYTKDHVDLNYKIDSSINGEIKFDHYHLGEIIELLIKNSIKYSKKKAKVIVDIRKKGKYIIFIVKDNGIGISKDQLKNLLSPLFPQSELSSARYTKPSIKLSYINKMLEFLDGKIEVKSKLGVGSEFSVFIPYEDNDIKHNKKRPTSNMANLKHKKLKILVVEDNPVTLKLHKNYLVKLGHTVETAANGRSAIKLALKRIYDIVFLDITLPDISGIEVMNEIKLMDREHTFFVAVTSHSSEKDFALFNKHDFATILSKPVTKNDFQECIATLEKMNSDND